MVLVGDEQLQPWNDAGFAFRADKPLDKGTVDLGSQAARRNQQQGAHIDKPTRRNDGRHRTAKRMPDQKTRAYAQRIQCRFHSDGNFIDAFWNDAWRIAVSWKIERQNRTAKRCTGKQSAP